MELQEEEIQVFLPHFGLTSENNKIIPPLNI